MARRKRYDPFRGRTSKELANISPTQLSKYSEREMHALVTKLSSAANKRIRNMEKNNLQSPALYDARRSGRFSGRGKSGSELKEEYYRLQRFFRDETSTVKGAKKFMKEMQDKVDEYIFKRRDEYEDTPTYQDTPKHFYDDYEKDFWSLYNRYYERVRDRNLAKLIKPSDFAKVVGYAMRTFSSWEDAEEYLENWINDVALEEEQRQRDYDAGNPNIIR